MIFLNEEATDLEGKNEKSYKFSMLKCWFVEVKDGYVILRPMKSRTGIKGSITYTIGKDDEKKLSIKNGDEVVALNVHKVGAGWRARKILIPII